MKKIFVIILSIFSFFCINVNKTYALNVIELNQERINLGINYTSILKLTYNTTGSSNVVWSSADPSIATVNNGIVTGKKIGTTYITASIGNSKATCIVNIIDDYIPITKIKTNTLSDEILINQTKKIPVTIEPSNATNKTLTYSSSNPDIVTVDQNGNITGKKVGNASISIYSPEYKTTYLVTVTDKIPLQSISINKTLEINEFATSKLTVTFSPSTATNKKITWKSSDTKIVTVDDSGNIKALAPGTANITVISNDGGYTSICKVTVKEISKELKNISLNKQELTLKVDEEETLTITYDPTYAKNKEIIWSSSDEKIATVENGKIKALKPGTVEIKAVSKEGNKEAICKLTVLAPPIESISFAKKEQTVYVGTDTILTTISVPVDSSLNNPIWTSSNEEIATIKDGILTAISVGEVTITISNEDGSIKAETLIKIIEKPREPLEIKIEGYNLNFKENIKTYTLSIGNEKTLNIKANIDTNKITIKGNNDLKNGSIITITINDKEKVTYIINIKKKENYTIYFIIAISILLFINIIRILLKNKKKK